MDCETDGRVLGIKESRKELGKKRDHITSYKHGKIYKSNKPHVAGTTWAGRTDKCPNDRHVQTAGPKCYKNHKNVNMKLYIQCAKKVTVQ